MERDPHSGGLARRRPSLPLLTSLRFFAAAEVGAFLRKWVADRERGRSHAVAVAAVTG
jgi:hypothetical protein